MTRVTVTAGNRAHRRSVSDEKLTGNPDDAVALTVNGDAASVPVGERAEGDRLVG